MKTFSAKTEEVERKWILVDAEGKILGRLASEVAKILRGKHRPIYTPHVDTGDHVIIINASKVLLTGKKLKDKVYYRYSGYPGGLKSVTAEKLMQTHPERLLQFAIKGMLPKNKLGRDMLKKIRIYAGSNHQQHAQKPEILAI
ncbi:MAG: 50S ribosomal protein L13 [Nitrospinae bacterium RIFCSPLOWO2_12_FULL_45_22]|nr:MAG: 50S ribosomal protein L13 [Nitrospinae bacterium RIFCSPLOWO2_12_FULL_45_22]